MCSNNTTTCNPHKAFSQTTRKTTRRILVICFIMAVTGKRCSRVPPAQSRPCSLLPHPLDSTFIIPTGIGRTKKHHPSSIFTFHRAFIKYLAVCPTSQADETWSRRTQLPLRLPTASPLAFHHKTTPRWRMPGRRRCSARAFALKTSRGT